MVVIEGNKKENGKLLLMFIDVFSLQVPNVVTRKILLSVTVL